MENVPGGDSTCKGLLVGRVLLGSLSSIYGHLRKGFYGYWQLEVAKEEEFNGLTEVNGEQKLRITKRRSLCCVGFRVHGNGSFHIRS